MYAQKNHLDNKESSNRAQEQMYTVVPMLRLCTTVRVPNCLDPDQDRFFSGPDLGPNILQTIISWPPEDSYTIIAG